MSVPPAVQQYRQNLNKEAFLNITRYLAASGKDGKESVEFRTTLRKENCLNIDNATLKEAMTEAINIKRGGLSAISSLAFGGAAGGGAGYGGGAMAAAAPAAASYGGGGAAAGKALGKAPGSSSVGGGLGGGQSKGGKPAPKPAAIGKGGKTGLPEFIGCKIQRYWDGPDGQAGRWYTAVATDFDSNTHEYVLTYNLGGSDEEFEKVNMNLVDQNTCRVTAEKLDLRQFQNSMAVMNSSVMQPYLPKAAAGGGGGGASKSTGKKRKSDDSSLY